MDIDNIWAMDVSLLKKSTLEKIRESGVVGKTVWFASVNDPEVAFATFNQKDGTAAQIQVVPAPSGKIIISRRSFFLKTLTPTECANLRCGRNILSVPYADADPIVAGAPTEREIYFIDRQTMRVGVIIY